MCRYIEDSEPPVWDLFSCFVQCLAWDGALYPDGSHTRLGQIMHLHLCGPQFAEGSWLPGGASTASSTVKAVVQSRKLILHGTRS